MGHKYKFFVISFLLLLIFSAIVFWQDIKTKYFFLAYKEKCLIVLSKQISSFDLNTAKDICSCIVREIKINKDKFNTSKLIAVKKIQIPPYNGQSLSIDEGLYKKRCIIKYRN